MTQWGGNDSPGSASEVTPSDRTDPLGSGPRGTVVAPSTGARGREEKEGRRLHGLSQALEELRVKEAMTWDVVTTHPEATIGHAAAVMFQGRFGSLPVVQDDKLVGMLTERDLLRALGSGSSQINIDIEGSPLVAGFGGRGRPHEARTAGAS
ncbi:MAG TPA: CBS domain-containing protein [Methylomirabilota bacterium]|nr:CBS domain-containing protein [Methylomirabilota bacterium]